MKNWMQRLSVFLGAGIVYVIGQYFRGYWWPDFTWPYHCSRVISGAKTYCDSYIRDPFQVAWSLIAAGEIFAIVGVILLFANTSGLRAWTKLSLWFVPLVTAFVVFAGPFNLSPLGLLNAGPGTREPAVWFFGFIYIVLTLGAVLRGRMLERTTSRSE